MSYGEFYTEMAPNPLGGWSHKIALDYAGQWQSVSYVGDGPYIILNDTVQQPNQALVGVTAPESVLDAMAADVGMTEVAAARSN